jgi:hypothetical protein
MLINRLGVGKSSRPNSSGKVQTVREFSQANRMILCRVRTVRALVEQFGVIRLTCLNSFVLPPFEKDLCHPLGTFSCLFFYTICCLFLIGQWLNLSPYFGRRSKDKIVKIWGSISYAAVLWSNQQRALLLFT